MTLTINTNSRRVASNPASQNLTAQQTALSPAEFLKKVGQLNTSKKLPPTGQNKAEKESVTLKEEDIRDDMSLFLLAINQGLIGKVSIRKEQISPSTSPVTEAFYYVDYETISGKKGTLPVSDPYQLQEVTNRIVDFNSTNSKNKISLKNSDPWFSRQFWSFAGNLTNLVLSIIPWLIPFAATFLGAKFLMPKIVKEFDKSFKESEIGKAFGQSLPDLINTTNQKLKEVNTSEVTSELTKHLKLGINELGDSLKGKIDVVDDVATVVKTKLAEISDSLKGKIDDVNLGELQNKIIELSSEIQKKVKEVNFDASFQDSETGQDLS